MSNRCTLSMRTAVLVALCWGQALAQVSPDHAITLHELLTRPTQRVDGLTEPSDSRGGVWPAGITDLSQAPAGSRWAGGICLHKRLPYDLGRTPPLLGLL
jgi:hypothetical protein